MSNNEKHFFERYKERYEDDITENDALNIMHQLEKQIKSRWLASFTGYSYMNRECWQVLYGRQVIFVVYDRITDAIVTANPPCITKYSPKMRELRQAFFAMH